MEELQDLETGFGKLKNEISPEINEVKEIKGTVDTEMQNLKALKDEIAPESNDNKDGKDDENELKKPEELMSPDSPMSPTKRRLLELQEQGKLSLNYVF